MDIFSSKLTASSTSSPLQLDGVVCVVDCVNIEKYLSSADICDDVRRQIAYADRILINKVDLVSEEKVRYYYPYSPILSICMYSMKWSEVGRSSGDYSELYQ